ncbi:MAG: hypothetical protein ACPGJS_00520 [Flammeovirgaceae bacterium]
MTLLRDTCRNLGGIQRLWIALQNQAAHRITPVRAGSETIILDREVFCEVGLDSGNYQESHVEDDGGSFFRSTINFQLRKDRYSIYGFERDWNRKRLLVVVKNRNGDFIIFRNMRLTRQKTSGEFAPDFNGFQFQLLGNHWLPSTYGQAIEAIFWFNTTFQAGAGRFDPSMVFTGNASWNFTNGISLVGNAIDTDGIAEGLNGNSQLITIDSETPAEGITELHFRDNSIAGTLRLDLLPNLQTGDFALNQIQSVTVGEWVNKAGVVIELRNNQLSALAQRQLLEDIANRFVGTSSDLKLGLFNQAEAPDETTMKLAVELYTNYGMEIRLPAVETRLTITHE